ncbi:hypothetical protein PVT71_09940 [Salipiger sp. H15]|uniref:Uncharacterized protein n=1 Tax=Alloyangia sp. H15 TaxID=3029062 RepID=A0AAU8AD51_9RHOB
MFYDQSLAALKLWQRFYSCIALIGFSLPAVCFFAALEANNAILATLEILAGVSSVPVALAAGGRIGTLARLCHSQEAGSQRQMRWSPPRSWSSR